MKAYLVKPVVYWLTWGLLLSGLLTTSSWAAEPPAAADGDTVTTIRYLRSPGSVSSAELANALGWFKSAKIKLDPIGYSNGGPESIYALVSGSVDIASAATSAIINAILGGAQIKGVMPDHGINKHIYSHFFVLKDSLIHGPQDLKGKTIAVNTMGAHLDYVVREYLRQNGLKQSDVRLVVVPGPQLEQVLRSKQVDVAAVGVWQDSFAGKIKADGGVRTLFTDYDVLGDISLDYVAFTKAFLKAHSQAVTCYVTLSSKAADWSQQHLPQARLIMAKLLKERGENPELAKYFVSYGQRAHGLLTAHDSQFWLDTIAREGNSAASTTSPDQIQTNGFNDLLKEGKNHVSQD